MRNIIIAGVTALFVVGCASTPPDPEPIAIDPRLEALKQVSISLEDLPPALNLDEYDIVYEVIEVEGERYVAMSTEDFRKLLLAFTEAGEHIRVLRNILVEQNRLIDRAINDPLEE